MGLHEAVRARWPALADRFVFVTGGAFSPDAKRFIEESVCAVIQKPFRVEDLLALIERKAREGGAALADRERRGDRPRRAAELTSVAGAEARARKLVVAALVRDGDARARVAPPRRPAHAAALGVPGRQGRARRGSRRRARARGARGARLRRATSAASTRSSSTPTRPSTSSCSSTPASSPSGAPRAVQVAEVAWVEAARLPALELLPADYPLAQDARSRRALSRLGYEDASGAAGASAAGASGAGGSAGAAMAGASPSGAPGASSDAGGAAPRAGRRAAPP